MTGLGCGDELFPRELVAVEVGGDRVVDTARVEREAAVEPPAFDAGTVAFAKFADNRQQIARQPGLIRSMIPDGILPGGVVAVIAGMVVVEDEMHTAGMAGIGEIAD